MMTPSASAIRIAVAAMFVWLAATPLAAQVSVSRLGDLSFGQVVAGTTEQVQPNASSAGRFQVTAPAGTQLSLTFALPATLVIGGSTLPVTFGSTDAAWSGTNDPAGATTFDPNQPLQVTVPPGGSIYVWVGARVSPPSNQSTGIHTGTLTLSASQV